MVPGRLSIGPMIHQAAAIGVARQTTMHRGTNRRKPRRRRNISIISLQTSLPWPVCEAPPRLSRHCPTLRVRRNPSSRRRSIAMVRFAFRGRIKGDSHRLGRRRRRRLGRGCRSGGASSGSTAPGHKQRLPRTPSRGLR